MGITAHFEKVIAWDTLSRYGYLSQAFNDTDHSAPDFTFVFICKADRLPHTCLQAKTVYFLLSNAPMALSLSLLLNPCSAS